MANSWVFLALALTAGALAPEARADADGVEWTSPDASETELLQPFQKMKAAFERADVSEETRQQRVLEFLESTILEGDHADGRIIRNFRQLYRDNPAFHSFWKKTWIAARHDWMSVDAEEAFVSLSNELRIRGEF